MKMVRRSLSILVGYYIFYNSQKVDSWETPTFSRRLWISKCSGDIAGVLLAPAIGNGASELPLWARDFTKLAPLGRSTAVNGDGKKLNLSLDELATRLQHDILFGSEGKGSYFLSGDLSQDIFQDDCVFVDPNNRVSSLSQYRNALRILFDPKRSVTKLVSPLEVNADERSISGRFRVRGFLQLPWNPYVSAFESTITYKVDENGLISEQIQAWTKSGVKALEETFTPTIFTPPPSSSLLPPEAEPLEVSTLFEYVNGRRIGEYSQEERTEIDTLIDNIAVQCKPQTLDQLPGKWMLVYLQSGPGGEGVDRRVPFFPEFLFNDSFQVFSRDSVTNIGELFGPILDVRVFGSLSEADVGRNDSPKRFIADITGGKLCTGGGLNCVGLPISGEGLFDSVYLGPRLRIGQNINGGGARIVQVKLS